MKLPRIARVECDGFDYNIFATNDYISQRIFQDGTWERTVHATAALLLGGFDAPVVIDVGANIGLFTVPVASRISAVGGKLFAFEAQRIVFQQLCANIFANRIDCVWAYNQAVGSEPGEIDMPTIDYAKAVNVGAFSIDKDLRNLRGLEAGVDTDRTERLALVTLNDFAIDGRVRLIKIDVEGMEIDVVRGARNFLEHHRYPPILFETWEDELFVHRRQALLNEIGALGYAVSRLGRDNFLAQHPANDALVEVQISGAKVQLSRIK